MPNKTSKIVATIALLAIVIWIIWTWVLFVFMSDKANKEIENEKETLTKEQLNNLIEKYNSNTITWATNTTITGSSDKLIDEDKTTKLTWSWVIKQDKNKWKIDYTNTKIEINTWVTN